ncbi:MAG: hypothetical protein Q8O76_15680 [Chloroflexota bacterium]|nr:hypothetical protein [Chloroflexota bacterium]
MGSEEQVALLRGLGRKGVPPEGRARVDLAPGCPFGALVEQRLRGLEERVDEVKARLNGLLFLVAGAVLVEIILRFLR